MLDPEPAADAGKRWRRRRARRDRSGLAGHERLRARRRAAVAEVERPRVTSSEAPSGRTSQSRTAASASGRSEVTVSRHLARSRAAPRPRRAARTRSRRTGRPRPAGRAKVAELPSAHQAPESMPRPAGRRRQAARRRAARRACPRPSVNERSRRPATASAARHPAPGRTAQRAAGRRVLHEGGQHRLVVDPVACPSATARTSAPPPAARRRRGRGRRAPCRVAPRADDPAPRHVEPLQQPQDRVRVAVGPAADREHGAADRGVVLATEPCRQ